MVTAVQAPMIPMINQPSTGWVYRSKLRATSAIEYASAAIRNTARARHNGISDASMPPTRVDPSAPTAVTLAGADLHYRASRGGQAGMLCARVVTDAYCLSPVP